MTHFALVKMKILLHSTAFMGGGSVGDRSISKNRSLSESGIRGEELSHSMCGEDLASCFFCSILYHVHFVFWMGLTVDVYEMQPEQLSVLGSACGHCCEVEMYTRTFLSCRGRLDGYLNLSVAYWLGHACTYKSAIGRTGTCTSPPPHVYSTYMYFLADLWFVGNGTCTSPYQFSLGHACTFQ